MIYEPAEDSYLLEKEVERFSKGKSFLDMGSGSGIQSLAAKKAGAKSILAVDVNPEVISYLKKNKIPCQQSDLFEKINGEFDLIAFNPPYLPEDEREDSESRIITSGGKKGDEIILRFLEQAVKHLEKNGIILLLVSSLTPQKKIGALLKKLRLRKKIIAEEKLFMEELEVWKISG